MERFVVELVQAGVPRGHLEELFPGLLEGLDIALVQQLRLGERLVPESVRWKAWVPPAVASNNWAISAGRSPAATRSWPAILTLRPTGFPPSGTRRCWSSASGS